MLYREIIAVCSQIHTKHTNTLCGQNVELLNVKPRGTYSYHWALIYYVRGSVHISDTCTTKDPLGVFPYCCERRSKGPKPGLYCCQLHGKLSQTMTSGGSPVNGN